MKKRIKPEPPLDALDWLLVGVVLGLFTGLSVGAVATYFCLGG